MRILRIFTGQVFIKAPPVESTSAAFLVFLFSFYFFNSASKILVTLVTLALRVANLIQKPVQRFLSYLWKWLKADKNIMLVNYNDTTKGHSSL